MDTDHAADHETRDGVDEAAIALLLRSPHLEVGQIMELMDIGDREFRDMASRNGDIAQRLEERRLGTLRPIDSEPKCCKSCREWFVPYGHDRYCSDACKRTARLSHCHKHRLLRGFAAS